MYLLMGNVEVNEGYIRESLNLILSPMEAFILEILYWNCGTCVFFWVYVERCLDFWTGTKGGNGSLSRFSTPSCRV